MDGGLSISEPERGALRRRVIVATAALLLAGCGRAPSASVTEQPPRPRFDVERSAEVSRHGPEDGGATPEDLDSDLAALRGTRDRVGSMLTRLAAGRPPIAGPTEVATAVGSEVLAYRSAGLTGSPLWFPSPTQFGGPRVFRVVDSTHPDAVQVSLPIKPNGQTGWIHRDAVSLSSLDHQILVDLDQDTVTVWDGDDVLLHTLAVTGTPWTPTPTGVFFVRDVVTQGNPNGAYGSHILALSGFSEVLDSFAGALPAIAIHGTNRPDTMGQERSNGCVRVPNELVELLATDLPLGTPVTIVSSKTTLGFGHVGDRFGGRRIY